MGTKQSLYKANKVKDDEYYTLYEDISNEVSLYKDQLKGKRILCPCDWDESYGEEIVYKEEKVAGLPKSRGTIKRIDIEKTKEKIEKDLSLIKCNFVKFLTAHADVYGITSISASGHNPATGKGLRFQDVDYSKYDLVITNPPFSRFREFIETMFLNKMQFLVIGPLTAITYKEVFGRIKNNEMWLGYAKQLAGFIVPDGRKLLAKNPEGSVARACKWYTNLEVKIRKDRIILTESYDPRKYPKYDNYGGIEISKVSKIPFDYDGMMGVPITFLQKYNPDQFEIVKFRKGDDNKDLLINGKYPYFRILIRNKEIIKDEK